MLKLTLIFIACSLTLINAQSKKEDILRKIKDDPFIKAERVYEKTGDEIYKLTYLPSGRITYKNFGQYEPREVTKGNGVDTTKIFLSDIDTTQFQEMYEYWMTLDILSPETKPILTGDFNLNEKKEFYGHKRIISFGTWKYNDWHIYEYNDVEKQFEDSYTFIPDSIEDGYMTFYYPGQLYDINKNGEEQLLMLGAVSTFLDTAYSRGIVFTNKFQSAFDLTKDFYFEDPGQINDSQFGNFDNDDSTDYVYFSLDTNTVKIFEYSPAINNFVFQYEYDLFQKDLYGGGYTSEDVDNDGYADLGMGTIHGLVFVFEYNPVANSYEVSYESSVKTYNAYLTFNTDDIDGNGKKEMWIGGDAFYDGEGITRITCFEADGDNNFYPVHVIDIHGVFSFNATNAQVIDVDKDGKNEILLCLDFTVYILKFTGSPDNPSYKLFYYKYNNFDEDRYSKNYYNASLCDINGDGYEELIISGIYFDRINQLSSGYTEIYSPSEEITSVNNECYSNKGFKLYANYPNPFNLTTNIEYYLPIKTDVRITLYDILGKEIAVPVNGERHEGYHSVNFNAKGLSNGIYFINMKTKAFSKTIKTILLK